MLVTLAHFAIHEFAHALAAKLLGYDVVITLNTVRPLKEAYDSAADASLISITGPVVTLLIALFAALYARRHKSLVAFMVVVSALFQRAIAQLVSLGNPNDEMRVSIDLGLGYIRMAGPQAKGGYLANDLAWLKHRRNRWGVWQPSVTLNHLVI